ncbi:MAG: hypothetical protein HRU24_16725 [Gammaproteobacteria bacterium]|nr:hypothetical protein [Gammaproteobacteria bacterium]
MQVESYAFGTVEIFSDNILIVVVNDGLEINGELARLIIRAIEQKSNEATVVIVDRRNDYSYSSEGMQTLSDTNLPQVIATGIVVYSGVSELVTACQIGTMKILGRNNLHVFRSLDEALSWGQKQITPSVLQVNC